MWRLVHFPERKFPFSSEVLQIGLRIGKRPKKWVIRSVMVLILSLEELDLGKLCLYYLPKWFLFSTKETAEEECVLFANIFNISKIPKNLVTVKLLHLLLVFFFLIFWITAILKASAQIFLAACWCLFLQLPVKVTPISHPLRKEKL